MILSGSLSEAGLEIVNNPTKHQCEAQLSSKLFRKDSWRWLHRPGGWVGPLRSCRLHGDRPAAGEGAVVVVVCGHKSTERPR